MKSIGFAVIVSVVLVAGCAQPSAQNSAELAALGETWGEHFNAGDMESVVALYTPDARLMAPNAEMIQGLDGIRQGFQPMLDSGVSATMETVEAMVVGDLGYRVGTYVFTAPDGAVADKGKYVEIWRAIGGEWKLVNDIFNSDMPSGAPVGALVIGSHEVEDAAVWLAAWEAGGVRHQQFAENGAPSVRVFQNPESPNHTGVIIDVTDMEAFQAYLASDIGVAAKAEDGVKEETLSLLVEVR